MDWWPEAAAVWHLSRMFGLPGSIKEKSPLRRASTLLPSNLIGSSSTKTQVKPTGLSQVSTPSPVWLCRVSESHGNAWDHFSQKKRNISDGHLDTTCSIQGWVSNEFEGDFRERSIIFQNTKLIAFSFFSAFSTEPICGFQVYRVFLILLISKQRNTNFGRIENRQSMIACMIK